MIRQPGENGSRTWRSLKKGNKNPDYDGEFGQQILAKKNAR